MSKNQARHKIKFASIFTIGIFILVYFQNCGRFEGLEPQQVDLSSEEVIITHPGEDHNPPPESVEKIYTNYKSTLADRYYLVSLFNEIFGPSAKNLVLNSSLGLNKNDYGSPCSPYENYYYLPAGATQPQQANTTESCALNATTDHLSANLISNPSVRRQAHMASICANLIANLTTFNYLLSRLQADSNSTTLPTPNADNVKKLILLFYRQQDDIPIELIQSLQVLINPTQPALSEWQNATYVVCNSSHWQVL